MRSVRSCALEDEVKDKDEYEYESGWQVIGGRR